MAEQPHHPEEDVIQGESERLLFAQFDVGDQMEEFLRSTQGQYLRGVAEQEIQEAVRTFLNNNPQNQPETVARAWQRAKNAKECFHWMMEAVQNGRDAEFQLREMDDEERP